ncbi:MAG TPA: hypothetical protein VFU01_08055 [Gemmatimonadaceae bacterium]|nr:hypothetical protein [Gemmatimonadaceae bacterium]
MRKLRGEAFVWYAALVTMTTACEDVTAPQAVRAIVEMEDRLAGLIADPRVFPDVDPIWAVAHLAQYGGEGAPVTLLIDDVEAAYRAIAYEIAYDPFVDTRSGRETVWRRGVVAWRGVPARDVIVLWAITPGAVTRPSIMLEPETDPTTVFKRRRAYRVRRDTTHWNAVEGVVSVGDPVPNAACRFRAESSPRPSTGPAPSRAMACTMADFDVSFDMTFERRNPAIEYAAYQKMMAENVPAMPFRGVSPTKIALSATRIPGIRFAIACGRAHGAASDSTCLNTDAPPSP